MVHERCAKKSFRDSLEVIKERMKEKRNKQLAKVTTANKNLSTKVKGKILQNSCVMLKNVQLNNKALAQALEIEKAKTRQAQDVILHLKRDYQSLKFHIFMLQRKLKSQEEESSAESKLSALREIISKVTANLLETADLLGPAHDLCFTSSGQRRNPSLMKEKGMTNSTALLHVPIREGDNGNKISENEIDNFTTVKNPDPLIGHSWQISERFISVQRGSRGRRAVIHHDLSVSQNEDSKSSSVPQNLSVQHSNYSFKQHDEPCIFNSPESSASLAKYADVEQVCAGASEGCIQEGSLEKIPVLEEDLFSLNEDQLNQDRLTLPLLTEIKSSTPDPKSTQSHIKDKATSQTGRGRKGRTDGMNVSLKKPWENSRPRTRSKSRERSSNKQPAVKIKMDTTIGSSDAYDFFSEESVHLTPFRQGKGNDESKMEASEQSYTEQSSSENDDSLYVPHNKKSKRQSIESKLNSEVLPSRPRSKRTLVLQKQQQQLIGGKEKKNAKSKEDSGNATSNEKENEKPVGLKTRLGNALIDTGSEVSQNKLGTDDMPEAPQAQHFGLRDVTNFSLASGQMEIRKISCPLLDCDQEKTETSIRKRRCTFTVNYKEPTLTGKLRRGDRFTDTEFLHSPIFKEKNSKRKSYKKRSLARYNEAFVGCR